jgi:hypothetical protein
MTKVNQKQTGRHKEVAFFNKHSYATLHQRAVEETDISDSSSDDDANNGIFCNTSSSGSSTPAKLLFTKEDTLYLRQDYEGQSFYDLVNPVDEMLGEEYTGPPLHRTSLLTSTALLQHNQNLSPQQNEPSAALNSQLASSVSGSTRLPGVSHDRTLEEESSCMARH